MNTPKTRGGRIALWTGGALALLGLGVIVGGALTGIFFGGGMGSVSSSGVASVAPLSTESYDAAAPPTEMPLGGQGDVARDEAVSSSEKSVSGTTPEPMMVKTATMEVRVEDVPAAVDEIKLAVKRFGAQVSDYSVSSGAVGMPIDARAEFADPTTAFVTIRVPSDKLEALQAKVADVGDVITESSNASDVTQQYVDMAARLKNLKAEEARLRDFLTKTEKVSELLQVESELSRVRGEIESMQAQLDYLSRQVEMSTLTVSLSEPGAVVRPEGIDWGFREALTRGVQGAAAVLTFLITVTIALAPLALIVVAITWGVRAILRRRAAKRSIPANDESTEEPAER